MLTNQFQGVNDPSGSPWTTPSEAATHIQKVSEQILRLDADVIAVHEVESCDVLSSLVGFLGSSYRFFLVPGTDTATGQDSAIVTKLDPLGPIIRTEARVSTPISGSSCSSASPSATGVSKHGRASFRASSFSFDLVFAHFKSGGLVSDCAQREGQASVLRDNLIRSGTPTIVSGDFNDWDSSFTDATGMRGTSLTLSTLKGNSLTNINSLLPLANRSSSGSGKKEEKKNLLPFCFYNKKKIFSKGLIDHILLSSDLVGRATSVSIDKTGLPSTSSGKLAQFFSDHLPVLVTLRDFGVQLVPMYLVLLLLLFSAI